MTLPDIDTRMQQIIAELQDGGITLEEATKAFSDKYVHVALRKTKGNVTHAARMLRVHRNTINYRLSVNEALRVKPKKRVYGRGRS
jgi:DNA-binding NtrC family response regulator